MKMIKEIYKRVRWKRKNGNNFTQMGHVSNRAIDLIEIGNLSYGTIDVYDFEYTGAKLKIGNACSISKNVRFLLAGEHDYKIVSSFPYKYWIQGVVETKSKGDIVVHDDVWIGMNTVILSGVTIGQGAIIAAGTTVYKDVLPYSIIGNNGFIRFRFTEDIISKLCEMDFGKLNKSNIEKYIDDLYKPIYQFLESETYKYLKSGN